MTERELKELAHRWCSIDKKTLVEAGVITGKEGGSDWKRFNVDPMTFILKLDGDALNALVGVLNNPHQ